MREQKGVSRLPGRLPDARLDHPVPVAVPAHHVRALGDARHVWTDDEVGRPAPRAPRRRLALRFLRLLGHAVGALLLALPGPPPGIAAHRYFGAACSP